MHWLSSVNGGHHFGGNEGAEGQVFHELQMGEVNWRAT